MIVTVGNPASPHSNSLLGCVQDELVFRIAGTHHDNQIVRFSSSKCSIGSDPGCSIVLRTPYIQPVHCLLVRGPRGCIVRCLSTDTRLNGRSFQDSWLRIGDRLTVGSVELDVVATGTIDDQAFEPIAEPIEIPQELSDKLDQLQSKLALRMEASQSSRKRCKRLIATLRAEREAMATQLKIADLQRDKIAETNSMLEEQEIRLSNALEELEDREALLKEARRSVSEHEGCVTKLEMERNESLVRVEELEDELARSQSQVQRIGELETMVEQSHERETEFQHLLEEREAENSNLRKQLEAEQTRQMDRAPISALVHNTPMDHDDAIEDSPRESMLNEEDASHLLQENDLPAELGQVDSRERDSRTNTEFDTAHEASEHAAHYMTESLLNHRTLNEEESDIPNRNVDNQVSEAREFEDPQMEPEATEIDQHSFDFSQTREENLADSGQLNDIVLHPSEMLSSLYAEAIKGAESEAQPTTDQVESTESLADMQNRQRGGEDLNDHGMSSIREGIAELLASENEAPPQVDGPTAESFVDSYATVEPQRGELETAVENDGHDHCEVLPNPEQPRMVPQVDETQLDETVVEDGNVPMAVFQERSENDHGDAGTPLDDDAAIEDYMSQLLDRLRGSLDDQSSAVTPQPKSDAMTAPKELESVNSKLPPVAPLNNSGVDQDLGVHSLLEQTFEKEISDREAQFKVGEFTPKHKAPENPSELGAMREVANASARMAIEVSKKKRNTVKSQLNLIGCAGSGVGAIVSFALSQSVTDLSVLGLLGSLGGCGYFGHGLYKQKTKIESPSGGAAELQ